MDLIKTLLDQGVLGAVAAIFIYLYIKEVQDHRKTLSQQIEDAKITREKIGEQMGLMAKALDLIYAKLFSTKEES